MNSTSGPADPMSADAKLGTAAEYLASQVAAGKKAHPIRSALRARAARPVGALRSAARLMARKADTGGTTTEGER